MIRAGELEIDSLGRIWRCKKRHGRGVKLGGGYYKGSTVSPCKRVRAEFQNTQGYLQIRVMRKGKTITVSAHRVVWIYYNRAIPKKMTINHKDGTKGNNRPGNLELATMKEQRRHALYVLKVNRNHPIGSLHPKTKLVESDVLKIRQLRQGGMMVKDIAQLYEMKTRAISAICVRRTWCHI